jgi:flagellar basal body-associated protein FliL
VGKKSSIAFIVIGIVLIVVAAVWWGAIAPTLTKLPSNLDTPMNFEGKLTQFVDSATQQPLPAGQELVIPLTTLRTFKSIPDQYTSSVAVCQDIIVMTLAGQEQPPQVFNDPLDRKTRKFVESDQSWAYTPEVVLKDRVGHYGPLFPGGLKVGDTVSAFFDDVSKAQDCTVVDKIDNWEGLGVTAIKIDAALPAAEYYPGVAQTLLASMGLPMELTFDQVSAQLKAKGLDLGALLAGLAQVAAPEDMQALQAITQQPIKLKYFMEGKDIVYIEQKTGATLGATLDRTTSMQIDTAGLLGAFAIIGKYATDPTIGPTVAGLMQAAGGLAKAGPTKVFNQYMSIIKTSEASLAQDAKDNIPKLALANLWIPLIIVIVGFLVLVAGAILMLRGRKTPAAPAPTQQ